MILRLAFRNLRRNPRRTLTILLTVAMGSGSLFIFSGFNHGIMNQYRENTIHARYGHGQINSKGYRNQVFEKPWEHWIGNQGEMVSELHKIPGVQYVFPRIEFFGLLSNGKITVSGKGQGIDGVQEAKFFTSLNPVQGVVLSDQADGIFLGRGLAQSLDVKVGDRVTALVNTVNGSMNGSDFTVTGIFHTGSKEFDDVVFRIPLEQTFRLLDTDRVESIALGLQSDSDWPQVASAIESKWPQLETTSFAVLDKVYYQHSVDWLKSQFSIIRIIILAIVVLGILNTISSTIMDRKPEIGNLRANGESSANIIVLLTTEGLILGILGAALGLTLSYLMERVFLHNGILMPPAPGLTRQFHVRIEFELGMAVAAFVLGSLTAFFATLLGATKASSISIAEALRSS